MPYQKFVSRMLSILLVMGPLVACEQGPEVPETTSMPRLVDFQQEISLNEALSPMLVDETIRIPVTVKNTSSETWPTQADGDSVLHVVHFSYHWLDLQGNLVIPGGHRTPFPHDINPGEAVSLDAVVQAPSEVGTYTLRFTAVQEGVIWFVDAGAQTLAVEVNVVATREQAPAVSEEPAVPQAQESAVEEGGAPATTGQEEASSVTAEPQPVEEVETPPVETEEAPEVAAEPQPTEEEAPPAEETQESQAVAAEISPLLDQARQQVQKQNFTTPKGDNALDTCLAILELAPGHSETLQLIQQMEQQYRDWAASTKSRSRRQTYSEKADQLASIVREQSQ